MVLRRSGKVGGELPEEERGRQPEGLAGRRLWPSPKGQPDPVQPDHLQLPQG